MKLHFSAGSPFVRKCMVVAHELGIADRFELLPAAAHPVKRDARIIESNPLGQVPTLTCDDGTVLYDSRVICEYLDAEFGGALFPAAGPARWRCLTEVALADGMTGAALLARYETAARPAPTQWPDWIDGQLAKVHSGIAWLDHAAPGFGDRVDIGTIAFGCALGYVDFRFPQVDWRAASPATAQWFARFSERPSMQQTVPKG
ncbi:glutathione S-transferase family protein [Variovorax ginsengisoli]|uniref:Glutathione S-transferase n=1 Tax=Variovorax ginsengisoli TaxID=363844 RepID=A0ABT9SF30_9BURK|nr:glutathione S-transferase [Variovorax ginsengisoli]MDP9902970.1 glutathione S-transferase [Variovorax ginsengisoli]